MRQHGDAAEASCLKTEAPMKHPLYWVDTVVRFI